jgi:hypothetical protein
MQQCPSDNNLPHHDEGSSNWSWGAFGRINGYCGALRAYSETENETSNLHIWSTSERTKKLNQNLTKRCGQEFVTPCQKQARAETVAVMKMAPLLPNQALRGSVSQQPKKAQHSYSIA